MRLPWDIQKYEKNDDPELKKNYSEVDLVYFMPTRHVWQTLWEHDFCKGNDKFIRAFAKFVKDDKPNVKLICVKKGPDVSVSMKLISDLEIEEYVEWIDEMNKDGIRAYNSLDNIIIVDQFGHDDWKQRWPNNREFGIGFSAIGYEAMSARNVLISTFTDLQFYDNTAPPVFMAFSEDEIYVKLVETLKLSAEERKTVGEKGFEFFHKYHNWESTTDNFIRQLENILKSDD
ncbi:MAG TPA: glycosyltransferase family 1 protein [Flavobacteriales bacterium]|nr:glycosyltransferase family 1 protein [Flavobacteriales bacterium]